MGRARRTATVLTEILCRRSRPDGKPLKRTRGRCAKFGPQPNFVCKSKMGTPGTMITVPVRPVRSWSCDSIRLCRHQDGMAAMGGDAKPGSHACGQQEELRSERGFGAICQGREAVNESCAPHSVHDRVVTQIP